MDAAPTLGPQPTPEMEAIAREVDALARERLALEAEVAARQRELTVTTGEADGLQVRGGQPAGGGQPVGGTRPLETTLSLKRKMKNVLAVNGLINERT